MITDRRCIWCNFCDILDGVDEVCDECFRDCKSLLRVAFGNPSSLWLIRKWDACSKLIFRVESKRFLALLSLLIPVSLSNSE